MNPPVLARARDALPALRVVGEEIALPLPMLYEPPGDLGRDRVMAAVGALDRRPDAPGVLVLDAGTCLVATVAVRGKGVLGGAILPGPDLMARALAEGTSALPQVELSAVAPAFGRSTADSIRAGIDAAIAGAVRQLVERCRAETEVALDVVAAGTGGGALAARLPGIDAVHPFATLWGVYRSASA